MATKAPSFNARKKRRQLSAKVKESTNQWLSIRQSPDNSEKATALVNWRKAKHALDVFESDILVNNAQRLGVDIPKTADWWEDDYNEQDYGGLPAHVLNDILNRWLTPKGRLMVAKLIREERRKNVEWWVRVIAPLLGALISLLGLVVALVTVSRR